MIISIRVTNTSFKKYNVSIIVSRINISSPFYTAFQDRDFINDLERFTALYNLELDIIYLTSYFFLLLLIY